MPDTALQPQHDQKTTHFDVLIVGAGISGIGGAYHLTKQCPGTSFVVLETRESFGGTSLTHRFPFAAPGLGSGYRRIVIAPDRQSNRPASPGHLHAVSLPGDVTHRAMARRGCAAGVCRI